MNQPPAPQNDAIATVIPYKNGKALASYYCGVFSLIPGLSFILGPLAIFLGVGGRRAARENPAVKGGAHAMTGIILGSITAFFSYGTVLFFVILAAIKS